MKAFAQQLRKEICKIIEIQILNLGILAKPFKKTACPFWFCMLRKKVERGMADLNERCWKLDQNQNQKWSMGNECKLAPECADAIDKTAAKV